MDVVMEEDIVSNRFDEFLKYLESDCSVLQSTAIHFFRKLFSTDPTAQSIPYDLKKYSRIIRAISRCLDHRLLQEESLTDAVWVITNLCCIRQEINHLVVNANFIHKLIKLTRSQNELLANQAIWALSNIAADCSACQKKCRSIKFYMALGNKLIESQLTDIEKRNIVWCINNLTSNGRMFIPNKVARRLIKGLATHLINEQTATPDENADKILWSLANLADDVNDFRKIDMILAQPQLLENTILIFLDENCARFRSAALRLIGNVAVGNDAQTDRLISTPAFRRVLERAMSTDELMSEAAWICSNIAAGLPRHVEYLIPDDHFYNWVNVGIHSNVRRLRKECLWIMANMLVTSDARQLEWLVNQGAANHIPRLLETVDVRLNEKALTASITILTEFPWQRRLFEKLGVYDLIRREWLHEDATDVQFQFLAQVRALELLLTEHHESNKLCKPTEDCDLMVFTNMTTI